MKKTLFILLILICSTVFAQTYTMPGTGGLTVTGCSGTILDPGGSGNYSINQNSSITIVPSDPNSFVGISFSEFNLENDFDFLYYYEGTNTLSGFIRSFTNVDLPPNISSLYSDKTLTLRFKSDDSNNGSGFVASITCLTMPLPQLFTSDDEFGSDAIASSSTLSITSNINWSITGIIPSWLTLSTLSGANSQNIIFSFANNVSLSSRSTVFTIMGAGIKETLDIFQNGAESLILSSINTALSANQTIVPLTVTTDVYPWTITGIPNWVTVNSISGIAGISNLVLTVSANNTQEERSAILSFNYLGTNSLHYIVQMPNNANIITMPGNNLKTTFTGCSGYILDPGGFGNYGNNVNSILTLISDDINKKVSLEFIHFRTEGDYDFLNAYDGLITTVGTSLYSLSGSTVPASSWSPNNSAAGFTLNFLSDNSNTFSGFVLKVGCEYKSFDMLVSGTSSITTCGTTLFDNGGRNNYSNNVNSSLIIYPTAPGLAIQLKIKEFTTEKSFDFLTIYNGVTTVANNAILEISGTNTILSNITSTVTSGAMLVNFKSDFINNDQGFVIEIGCILPTALPACNLASPTISSTNGVLTANSTSAGATFTWYKEGTSISGINTAFYATTVNGSYSVNNFLGGCTSSISGNYLYTYTTSGTGTTIGCNLPTVFVKPIIGGISTNITASGATFIWYKDGTSILGVSTNTYTTTVSGLYNAQYSISTCTSPISEVFNYTFVPADIKSNSVEINTTIYPNPSNGSFLIETDYNGSFSVINVLGEIVFKGYLKNGPSKIELGLQKGVYYLITDKISRTILVE